MKLEKMFRRVHANSANLFHGRSPLFEICNDLILAQSMPSGAVHPITRTRQSVPMESAQMCLVLAGSRSRPLRSGPAPKWTPNHTSVCARDFDKVMFNLPIPRFNPSDPLHNAIAGTACEAEALAASVPLPENVKFQRARGLVRAALTEAGVAPKIDGLVAKLLDGA